MPPTKPPKAGEEFRLANRPLVGNLDYRRFYTARGPLLTVAHLTLIPLSVFSGDSTVKSKTDALTACQDQTFYPLWKLLLAYSRRRFVQ